MAKTIPPSEVTQITAVALCKSSLPSKPTQQVLEHHGSAIATEFVASARERVEEASIIIVCRVRVDRTRTPQQAIDATGREAYLNEEVVATMPQGEGDVVDVHFIRTKRSIPVSVVPAFLAHYGLVPDPRAQAAVNEADPAFADKYPNCTQWGNNCGLGFGHVGNNRLVFCGRVYSDWEDNWLLSGVLTPGYVGGGGV